MLGAWRLAALCVFGINDAFHVSFRRGVAFRFGRNRTTKVKMVVARQRLDSVLTKHGGRKRLVKQAPAIRFDDRLIGSGYAHCFSQCPEQISGGIMDGSWV